MYYICMYTYVNKQTTKRKILNLTNGLKIKMENVRGSYRYFTLCATLI